MFKLQTQKIVFLDIELLITHLHFYETCPSIICTHSTHSHIESSWSQKNYSLISYQWIIPLLWAQHPINPKPSTKWPNLSKKGGRHTLWQIAPICSWIHPRVFHALWLTGRLRGKKGHNEPEEIRVEQKCVTKKFGSRLLCVA